jgi:yecA family protein
MSEQQDKDIDHDNAERLAALLQILAASAPAEDEAVPIDTLDGYMTALLCGPRDTVQASPLQAMDALFGDDWATALDEQEATEEFMEVLHQRWNEIDEALDPAALAADPEAMLLTPLITEFDEATKAELLSQGVLQAEQLDRLPPPGLMWVEGFMQAVEDHQAAWYVHDSDSEQGQMLAAMLMAIAAVAMPPGEQRDAYVAESYEPDDIVDQNVLLDDALFSAQDLRMFWLQPASGQLLS